jgi:hypothetical protein
MIAGGIALSIPASATDLTFTVQGTITSFIDVDNVYGFGVGANLAGDAVTDVYTIDTSTTTLTTGMGPYGPGSSYQAYVRGFGSGSLSSTIGGSTITINITNGDYIVEYNDLLVSPPQPYNRSLLELQAVGDEATGNAIGSEFLIRDEVVSYSLILPVPLNGLDLSALDFGGANAEGSGVLCHRGHPGLLELDAQQCRPGPRTCHLGDAHARICRPRLRGLPRLAEHRVRRLTPVSERRHACVGSLEINLSRVIG